MPCEVVYKLRTLYGGFLLYVLCEWPLKFQKLSFIPFQSEFVMRVYRKKSQRSTLNQMDILCKHLSALNSDIW